MNGQGGRHVALSGRALYMRGRYREALDMFDGIEALARGSNRLGAAFARRQYAVYACFYLGRLREEAQRTARLLRDIEDRGDVYSSFFLHSQSVRGLTAYVRGCCAIASIDREVDVSPRRARVGEARRLGRRLERERSPWGPPFAAIVLASAANASGERADAIDWLRRAVRRAEGAEMALHAWAARHQLGALLGGRRPARCRPRSSLVARASGAAVWCDRPEVVAWRSTTGRTPAKSERGQGEDRSRRGDARALIAGAPVIIGARL